MTITVDESTIPSGTAATAKDVTVKKNYWNDFDSRFNISHPSQFCVRTAIGTEQTTPIVEFGGGNGHNDLSAPAIEKNMEKLKGQQSTKTSSTALVRAFVHAIAIAAAIGCTVSLLVSKDVQHNLRSSNRRSLLLQIDPKTVELRPLPQLPSYRVANSDCVSPQEIIDLSEAIKELYLKHRIRVFPRNGFLLGIIRHGGFLPIEHMDVDLGVVYSDILPFIDAEGKWRGAPQFFYDFKVKPMPTENYWVNWKGIDPLTKEPYPYFGVKLSRGSYRMHAYASYPYRDTNTYFYPRLDKAEFNHKAHVTDSLRYNQEGADYRLLDTDERMDETNFKDDIQVGNIFHTTFDCFKEVPFYFTTIHVPCEYDAMLTSQYGRNWNRVEKRGSGGGPRHSSAAVSDKENDQILNGGPRPVCKS